MTTGEWITTLIASNTLTLGLATLVTSIMIKNSELKAKVGNDNRDATIEKIKTEQASLEKEVLKLTSDREKLMNSIAEKSNFIASAKKDISRLKTIVLSNSRKQRVYLTQIETQEKEITTLENAILALTEKLSDVNSTTKESILDMQYELRLASRSIQVVKRAMRRLRIEAEEPKEEAPLLLR